MILKTDQKSNKMVKKINILLICFFLLHFYGCKNEEEVIFTGYTPLSTINAIHFDTLIVTPIFLNREYYGGILDTNYYWDIYELNNDEKISLKCSSQQATVADNFADSLIINRQKFSILNLFKGQIVRFRIIQILKFNFDNTNYLVLIGRDKDEGGNITPNSKVILARKQNDSVDVFCPPLTLDYGVSNSQSFLSDYFCDLNHDKYLDFLQWNSGDTINVYSLIKKEFVKQKEFIKLFRKNQFDDFLFIDKKHSNWPYPYFKASDKFPDAPIFNFQPSYY